MNNKKNYLDYIFNPMELLRTKKVLQVNPTVSPDRSAPVNPKIILYEYDKDNSICLTLNTIEETYEHLSTPQNTWINIDGLRKVDIENICTHFGYSSINRRRYFKYWPAAKNG